MSQSEKYIVFVIELITSLFYINVNVSSQHLSNSTSTEYDTTVGIKDEGTASGKYLTRFRKFRDF